MLRKMYNKKGFSLIELIVVIAILAIIAAVAIPRFAAIQERSEIKADATTAAEVVNAARIQEQDRNNGTVVVLAGAVAGTSELLIADYMTIPTPQAGGSFTLSGGGTNPYQVVWTTGDGRTATVTENVKFDYDTHVVTP